MMTKSYNELLEKETFEDKFEYLKTNSKVGAETFGCNRYLNQQLYSSKEWKHVRNTVILRDNGCDLGVKDRIINGRIIVHHINPITVDDVLNRDKKVFDLNNLICVSEQTHNAIHYSDDSQIIKDYVGREPNDTIPWKG